VYIVKKHKKVCGFHKKFFFQNYKKLMKVKFYWRQIFEILIIYKPSLEPCEIPYKIWA